MKTAEQTAASVSEPSLPSTVYTVTPDVSVSDVARLMVSGDVGDVIVAEDQKPVGILTDRDIVVRVLAAGLDGASVKVRDVMSAPPVTISRNAEVEAAVALMGRHGIRRLPIVDEAGRLCSILTLDNLLLLSLDSRPDLREIIQQQLRSQEKKQRVEEPDHAPETRLSDLGASARPTEAQLARPVSVIARVSVVTPRTKRQRPTGLAAVAAAIRRNRLWPVILLVLSLLGAGAALLINHFGTALYHYRPTHYEPKDEERRRFLERQEREEQAKSLGR